MKLIRVSYRPATNTRGSRMLATDGDRRVTAPYGYHHPNDQARTQSAAQAFCEKHCPNYRPEFVGWFGGDTFFRLTPNA